MNRARLPRHVRKNLWRLLGFSTPREQRLARETSWRTMAPIRQALEDFGRAMAALVERITRAFSSLFATLGKVQPHAFS